MKSYDAGVYDIYDDGGALLKRAVPNSEDIPDFVKTAAQVGKDGDHRLYALVMVDDGSVMKKFATADPGNTWLSTLYFALTKDDQKVAAANLIEACDAFDIPAPDMLWEVADGPVEGNIVDVSGTAPPTKIASAPVREDVEYAIERADGSKYYPLRDARDVTTAMDYFDRHAGDFVPRERREFAVKVASVAKRGALPLTEKIASYSAEGWNPALEGHLTTRYMHLTERDAPVEVKERLIKIAQLRSEIGPNDFANVLEQFDIDEGLDALWDRSVADPWYSTLGMDKVAKGDVPAPESFTVGGTTVTTDELHQLAERSNSLVSEYMGEAFARAFLADPVRQFKALPTPNQKWLARLATTNADDATVG
jgi:hypothetical protein